MGRRLENNTEIDSKANKGDLSFKIDETSYNGVWRKIMEGLNSIAKATEAPIICLQIAVNELKLGNFDLTDIERKITDEGIDANC